MIIFIAIILFIPALLLGVFLSRIGQEGRTALFLGIAAFAAWNGVWVVAGVFAFIGVIGLIAGNLMANRIYAESQAESEE